MRREYPLDPEAPATVCDRYATFIGARRTLEYAARGA
jgi:hypothetical protein